MNFSVFPRFSISLSLIIIYSLSDPSSLSVSLRVSFNKFPSSNYANVITSPVCYLEDVTYGVYVTSGRIAIASAYGRDVYDICDGNQTPPNIDKREARLKISDGIKQKKSQWKGALRATHKMGKGLHRVFSTIVLEISQYVW